MYALTGKQIGRRTALWAALNGLFVFGCYSSGDLQHFVLQVLLLYFQNDEWTEVVCILLTACYSC